jgi:transcriptional regulator with XRE-family HTH domain
MAELGITQEDLCAPLKVKTRGAVGHYLASRRKPSPEQMEALAGALRCNVDWLLCGRGPMQVRDYQAPEENITGYWIDDLPPDEQALLEKYRQLKPQDKMTLQEVINALVRPASPARKSS